MRFRLLAASAVLLLLIASLARCGLEPAHALQPVSAGDLPALGAAAEVASGAQASHDAEAIATGIAARAEAARRAEQARQLEARRAAAARTSRGARSSASGGDFWAALAGCESPSNSWSGRYKGYFQFSDSNVRTYGISPSSSYEQQRAAAQRLAHDADPHGQWPTCWRRAGGG